MHLIVSMSKEAEMFLRALKLLTVKDLELLASFGPPRDPTGERGRVPA